MNIMKEHNKSCKDVSFTCLNLKESVSLLADGDKTGNQTTKYKKSE
jgi:hypothetical protein